LPYFEQGALQASGVGAANTAQFQTQAALVHGTSVSLLQCPSDPRAGQPYVYAGQKHYTTGYVGVTGNDEWFENGGTVSNARNGLFAVHSWDAGARVAVRIVSVIDGTSTTVAIGERPPAADLSYGLWLRTDGHTLLAYTSRTHYHDPVTTNACPPVGVYQPETVTGECAFIHYWSLHPGGANWLFADASVRFISYPAGVQVLTAMTSINGGETVDWSEL
jgi:prepilin-type processing-associated H-X9-DG protein